MDEQKENIMMEKDTCKHGHPDHCYQCLKGKRTIFIVIAVVVAIAVIFITYKQVHEGYYSEPPNLVDTRAELNNYLHDELLEDLEGGNTYFFDGDDSDDYDTDDIDELLLEI